MDAPPPPIPELLAAADTRRVDHAGGSMVWRGFGRGAPRVLLHGGHGSWLHWVRNVEPLARGGQVWVCDLPGFGESDDLPGAPHDPDRLERLLDALQGSLEILLGRGAGYDLAGFSFGGLVAARLAARGAGVGRLALIGPGGHRGRRPRWVEFVDWRLPDPAARRAALRHNLEVFMLHGVGDELALHVHASACEATRFRSKAISLAGGLAEALDAAARPTWLLWGEHDVTAVPHELGPALCAGRAERCWTTVDGAGHWASFERADAVNAWLARAFSAGDGR